MKFLLTKEVGKLARWLRILGYDATYYREENTAGALLLALREGRVIITRNKVFFDKVSVKSVYLTQEKIKDQLGRVIKELNLKIDEGMMFTRCILCNKDLEKIKKEMVIDRVPPYVFKIQDKFMECLACKRIYWPGSHWGNIRRCVKEIAPKIKN